MFTSNLNTVLSSVSNISTTQVTNYLRPNAFRFSIDMLPGVAYTCQSANLPSVQLGIAMQPTPFIDIPIRFLISEDMSNYLEIYQWLVALGFPNDYNQYKGFTNERLNRFPFVQDSKGRPTAVSYADGTLTILDSNNIPKTNLRFKDMFPTSVEALDFDITSASVEYFVGIASFKYKSFDIEAL